MATKITGGIDDALSHFVNKTAKMTTELTMADKLKISEAGGEVFRDALEQTTRQKHYSHHQDTAHGHMADHVSIMAGKGKNRDDINTDLVTGSVLVGWDNFFHAMNALRLNDGTSKLVGDHFVTNLRADSSIRAQILNAERDAYNKVANSKKGDDA